MLNVWSVLGEPCLTEWVTPWDTVETEPPSRQFLSRRREVERLGATLASQDRSRAKAAFSLGGGERWVLSCFSCSPEMDRELSGFVPVCPHSVQWGHMSYLQ